MKDMIREAQAVCPDARIVVMSGFDIVGDSDLGGLVDAYVQNPCPWGICSQGHGLIRCLVGLRRAAIDAPLLSTNTLNLDILTMGTALIVDDNADIRRLIARFLVVDDRPGQRDGRCCTPPANRGRLASATHPAGTRLAHDGQARTRRLTEFNKGRKATPSQPTRRWTLSETPRTLVG